MERLAHAFELLDGPLDDAATLAGNLRDLRRINRLLGGVALSRRAVDRLLDGQAAATLVDVGTGGADIPVALLADARRRGRGLAITAIDSRPEVLAAAGLARPGLADLAGLTLQVSDGRALPYPDASFDVAHTSLVIHHLEPDEAVELIREMARVARAGIVVNDLARARIHFLWARLITKLLTRNRFTRFDGPLSVQRAYTAREMEALLAKAGLRVVARFNGLFGHRYAFAATHDR